VGWVSGARYCRALARRAEELGAVLRHRCWVSRVEVNSNEAVVYTTQGKVFGRLVAAARWTSFAASKSSGLDAAPNRRRRFALRQHYKIRPWTNFVEVYIDDKGEAVVTPVSDESVGITLFGKTE